MIKVKLHKRTRKYPSGKVSMFWVLRWCSADGDWRTEQIGTLGKMTRAKADEIRQKREQDFNTGAIPLAPPEELTLRAFRELFKAEYEGDVAATTMQITIAALKHLGDAIGDETKIMEIDTGCVAKFRRHLRSKRKKNGDRLSDYTIDSNARAIRAAFNRVMPSRRKPPLILDNPFAMVRMGHLPETEVRVYSRDQVGCLRRAATTERWELLVVLGATTGLRTGEMFNLTWDDVNLEDQTIRVAARLQRTVRVHGETYTVFPWVPKTGKAIRTVPINDDATDLLTRAKLKRGGSPYVLIDLERIRRAEEVFAENDDAFPPRYQLFNTARWSALVKRAKKLDAAARKIKPEDVEWEARSIHDLRRTYATELARAGTPVKVLMTLMGHQSLQTTMKYYAKVEGQDIAKVRDHLNQSAIG